MQYVARIQIYALKFKTHIFFNHITENFGYTDFPFRTIASVVMNFENKYTVTVFKIIL